MTAKTQRQADTKPKKAMFAGKQWNIIMGDLKKVELGLLGPHGQCHTAVGICFAITINVLRSVDWTWRCSSNNANMSGGKNIPNAILIAWALPAPTLSYFY